jgi:lactate dehydrogenase-like 2-hydroxyacid dehydrogenase
VKPDLLLIGPLIPHAMAQLEAAYTVHRYDLAADKEALIAELAPRLTAIATRGDYPLPGALMRRFPNAKIIASSGTGYDGVDVASARQLGIAVTNSPGAASECVADAAWALILATVRRTVFNDAYVRAGGWLKAPVPLTDKVWGERLGVIGLGAIGKAIARRAEGFRMEVAYHGRHRQPEVAYRYYASPFDLARAAKILVVALPGGKGNQGFVDRNVIDALGPHGYLINISRGTNVDEPYLVDALVNKRLAGAGLDVFADEPRIPEALFGLDHVVLQPHAASGTHATRNALGQFVVDNLAAHFAGKPLLSPV